MAMYLNPVSASAVSDDSTETMDALALLKGESCDFTTNSKAAGLKPTPSLETVSIALSTSTSDLSDCDSTDSSQSIVKTNREIDASEAKQSANVQVEPSGLDLIAELLAKHVALPIDTKEELTDMEAAMRLRLVDAALSDVHDALVRRAGLYGRRDGPFVDPEEPLTHPDTTRYALSEKPDMEIQEMVKKQEACVWFTPEIDLASDNFDALDKNTRFFLENVLAFFAASDGIVSDNLCKNVQEAFTLSEIRQFFAFQNMMETIHSETYGLLLQTYVRDDARRRELREAIHTLPCVQKKAQWALHWARPHHSLAERLVAYTCVEGIHFSGSFCAIFYLKSKGVMPGLAFSNELISRDEGMHCDFGCLLHKKLKNPCSQEVAHKIIQSAVEVELDFVTSALPVRLLGMNADLMCCYIKLCANRLAVALDFEPLYNEKEAYNPFDWMELISLQGKTNFFEKRVGEYQKAGVMDSLNQDQTNRTFDLDADF